ncbi:glycosyl transferase [Coemansia sp. RSA 2131]|nr:glycosyl transferase [Coemansia sp. RSA 2131]
MDATEIALLVVGTSIKLLLWPAYHSTDFEVHRNWLAITSSLPISQWYFENRSEWTLDYPPLFAWFEWTMSVVARVWDPRIVDIDNLGYASPACVMFQRLSVLVSELVLFMALRRVVRIKGSTVQGRVSMALVFLSPGFLFVDHVHFQYNGVLLGMLVYSISLVMEGRDLLAGTVFAILLSFKHIFMYIAPAYFVYLLRHYCAVYRNGSLDTRASIVQVVKLGSMVALVFGVSFGPFAMMGQMSQVLSRLFPFKRGLCHAFWAPNFWALYVFADRILSIAMGASQLASSTRGLIGDTRFAVLPTITPLFTFIATLVAMAPALIVLVRRNLRPEHFVQSVVLCALASFMFGWHVHEKAIILVAVPLGVLAMPPRVLRMHATLTTAGFYSLLPLLFGVQELVPKMCVLGIWTLCSLWLLRADGKSAWKCLSQRERIYIAGFGPLFVATELVPCVFGRLEFLPLALVSVYTSLGIIYAWINLSFEFTGAI